MHRKLVNKFNYISCVGLHDKQTVIIPSFFHEKTCVKLLKEEYLISKIKILNLICLEKLILFKYIIELNYKKYHLNHLIQIDYVLKLSQGYLVFHIHYQFQ